MRSIQYTSTKQNKSSLIDFQTKWISLLYSESRIQKISKHLCHRWIKILEPPLLSVMLELILWWLLAYVEQWSSNVPNKQNMSQIFLQVLVLRKCFNQGDYFIKRVYKTFLAARPTNEIIIMLRYKLDHSLILHTHALPLALRWILFRFPVSTMWGCNTIFIFINFILIWLANWSIVKNYYFKSDSCVSTWNSTAFVLILISQNACKLVMQTPWVMKQKKRIQP